MGDIYTAIEDGNLDLIRELARSDPSVVNRQAAGQVYPPLAHAIREMDRSFPVIELLVLSGANVNWKTAEGYTPLHMNMDMNGPTGSGELPYRIAALLKEHGADVEARNHYGWTPLMRAALEGTVDEFAALLDIGASFTASYLNESMPYFTRGQSIAQVVLPRPEKVRLLLRHGLLPTEDLLESARAAIAAAKEGHPEYVSRIKDSIRLLTTARAS
jgi:ankyrin repeat protein